MRFPDDDQFVVWLRPNRDSDLPQEQTERVAGVCRTQEEAEELRKALLHAGQDAVVRYQGGEAGAGD